MARATFSARALRTKTAQTLVEQGLSENLTALAKKGGTSHQSCKGKLSGRSLFLTPNKECAVFCPENPLRTDHTSHRSKGILRNHPRNHRSAHRPAIGTQSFALTKTAQQSSPCPNGPCRTNRSHKPPGVNSSTTSSPGSTVPHNALPLEPHNLAEKCKFLGGVSHGRASPLG